MSDRQVERTIVIDTTPEMAFEAVTKASELREWMCDYAWAQVQPKGPYYFRWDGGYYANGRFTELEPPRRAVMTWQGLGEPGETTVTWTVESAPGGVAVTVVHSGFGQNAAWDEHVAASERGWSKGLDNLKSTLETGVDLRIARRPFMGILFDGIDAARAAKEGIAVDHGVYVNDTVEGSGARAAGLVKSDVIITLDGVELTGYHEIGAVLGNHLSGDVIEAAIVHGQERRTVAITLGQRPQEDIAGTVEDLVRRMAERYGEADAALKAALAGVTDEEASRAPAEGEWSVKQALAHLSIVERDHQCYTMAFAVDGWVDTGPGNPTADAGRLAAAMEITPTLEGLLARFLADGAETIALARHLPADMVAHKARFRRVSQGMVYLPDHTKEHVEQIKAAIQAARAG
jgi:uncharacterized protein YndB with AHSA1/START domain